MTQNLHALAAAQRGATTAYYAAGQIWNAPGELIRKAWQGFETRSRQAQHDPAALLQIATEADAFMRGIVALSDDERRALQYCENAGLGVTPEHRAAAAAAMASQPGLATWQAARDAEHERVTRTQQAMREAEAEAYRRARPGRLLAELRARGVDLKLTGDGNLTVPPGTALTSAELAEVRDRKADIAAILASEAPIVIA